MKKYLLITLSILSFGIAQSQEVRDGVRYAQGQLSGTSRFRSMSGAFGALGGDFSAINVNPAGSGIFASSQVGITMANYNVKNKSSYYGSKSDESDNTFDLLNQAGAAFVFHPDNDKTNWKKFVLSVNYENTNNFDNSKFSLGTNPTNSVGAYFTNRANNIGVPVGDLDNYYYDQFTLREQTAYLGYHAYVINPTNPANPDNTTYSSNVASGGNYFQQNTFNSTGYNGKLAFNASTEYRDKFYFGINLNTHFVDYRQSTSFYEDNSNSTTSGLTSLRFDQDLQTYGNGFSFQLGAIAKVTKALRLGLAYESPTWYEFTDEMRQVVRSSGYNFGNPGFGTAATDSDVFITYDPYRLHTPGKWTASGAYVFGKSALISVDYSVKDYGNTKFRPNSDYFDPVNAEFKDQLDVASEIRVGGEYRIKQFSLRGGYRFEGSPYKDGTTIGDLNSFSAGFGYNFGFTKLDFSYAYTQRKSDEGFFSYGFTGAANGAEIKSVYNTVSASLVFEL